APALCHRHGALREQHIVQFVGIADQRPGLALYLRNHTRVQPAKVAESFSRERPPHSDRPGSSLLERGIVEKGIGVCVQQLMGERRWLTTSEAHQTDRAR